MHSFSLHLAMAATMAIATPMSVRAQSVSNAAQIQQRYDSEVTACNQRGLPAPARDACVRQAGITADRARGGPPVGGELTTPDGRATLIAPPGTSLPPGATQAPSIAPPEGSAGLVTTPDGRATVVQPPSGSQAP